MAHCEICGSHLGLRDALRSLVRRRSQTYPARTPGGERIEYHVRWICHRCIRRGRQHRSESTPAKTAEQAPAVASDEE
jgi:hypothetical protein